MKKELAVKDSQIQQWDKVKELLTPAVVKQYICPDATDVDLFLFLQLCKTKKLNPFIKDVYLIKYAKSSPAAIVTAKNTFFKRADAHPMNDGMESGVVVRKGTHAEHRPGGIVYEGETLLGGWAIQHRKDWKVPARIEVDLKDYIGKKHDWKTGKDEINQMWKGKKATMIIKVAAVQAKREAFPNEVGDLMISEEINTGNATLSTTAIDTSKIKPQKETVIDIEEGGVVEEKKEPAIVPFLLQKSPGKKEPEKKATKPQEKKAPKKAAEKKEPEKKEEKLTPLEKKLGELYNLVNLMPISDLEEKAKVLVTLQKTLKIPGDKKMMDYSKEDAEAMILLIKKQFPEEGKEEPEKEEKRVLRKDEVLCVDCKKNVLRKDTATYKYAMKNFGEPVCYNCGQARRKK